VSKFIFILVYVNCLIFLRRLAHCAAEMKGLSIVGQKLRRMGGRLEIVEKAREGGFT
jgi:hypothetical protein